VLAVDSEACSAASRSWSTSSSCDLEVLGGANFGVGLARLVRAVLDTPNLGLNADFDTPKLVVGRMATVLAALGSWVTEPFGANAARFT
jgi:hypothetical protein